MRAIPTNYIKDGAILGEDLFTAKGIILLRKGTKLNSTIVKKINDHKIFTVYINDEHSDSEVNRLISQSYRVQGTQIIKELFDAATQSKGILSAHNKLSALADDILYELSTVKDYQIEYTDIKNVDIYVYSSALNVAVMAALLAWDLQQNNEMVKQIFLGAIYHDIGIAMLPENVINKSTELTIEEKMMIIKHPIAGHTFLKDKAFLSAYIKVITLQHHEHIDGSGYPNRVKGEDINCFAQIVGIVDVYDAMTSDRPYKKGTTSKEAIEYIMGAAGTHFDFNIASAFMKRINPYPKGSLVELSDGRNAVIDFVQNDLPLRPVIKIISRDGDSFRYETVDLRIEPSIIINDIIHELTI